MRIDRLELKNYRGFTSLDLDFTGHRTTVLVGSNGCGKTSVLDGLAAMLKWLASSFTRYSPVLLKQDRSPLFVPLDVNNKQAQLDLVVFLALNGPIFSFRISYQRLGTNLIPYIPEAYTNEVEAVHRSGPYPVLVYYPVSRAVLDIPLRIDEPHSFTQMDAYNGALGGNERNFRAFFEWYRDREDLENEARQEPSFRLDAQLEAVRRAIYRFMPGYTRLRVRRSPLRMTLMKGAQEVQVTQLSDGEKCLLALVGDLARRLALANPGAESPCDGTGVVLIDEIELHLHPRWQRSVIPNLERTFPNCQFIVTTHSPQVLADVGPGAVVVLEPDADGNVVAKRAKSPLGHDSNYILEVLMGVSERPQALADELERLFALIDDNDLAEAKKLRASIIEKWNADIPALTKAEVAIQRKERFAK